MRTIVHLSDLHFGRVDPRVVPILVRAINDVAPHLVVVSGDLTQRARRHQFLEARRFLEQLSFATLVVPGNHDLPLYNVVSRFLRPLAAYRRYIQDDLAPIFRDDEMTVVGLNSARAALFGGGGRLNADQVQQAMARFQSAPGDRMKIVVTHHPFELPTAHAPRQLIGRSQMAMEQLASVGVDLFLAGHLHVSHVAQTAERYKIVGHSALVVQAGTLSTRGRGEPNSFNIVRLGASRATIERQTMNADYHSFETSWTGEFQRSSEGWSGLPDNGPSSSSLERIPGD